jgi:hypothetical protein
MHNSEKARGQSRPSLYGTISTALGCALIGCELLTLVPGTHFQFAKLLVGFVCGIGGLCVALRSHGDSFSK